MSHDHEALLDAWRREERGPSGGWDFSALSDRMGESPVPWDLDALYRDHLRRASAVLDMGTGGGEFLRRFRAHLPADTIATEGWSPNVPIARRALALLGVPVVEFGQPDDLATPAPMPFPDARFDLILNRHESFHPREIARVLRPGGVFLTQQVGGDEFARIRAVMGHPASTPHVRWAPMVSALREAGLIVEQGEESIGTYEFADVAALVAYLQLVPWDAPADFSVDRYAQALLTLHEAGPARGEPVRAERIRFWIRALHP